MEDFAQGIIAVANAVMEKAIRVISIERGHDPRDYTLIAFGGAGGLHACDLAAALEMRNVLVPVFPGGLSALGILRADVVKELSRTVLLPAKNNPLAQVMSAMEIHSAKFGKQGRRVLHAEGFAREENAISAQSRHALSRPGLRTQRSGQRRYSHRFPSRPRTALRLSQPVEDKWKS